MKPPSAASMRDLAVCALIDATALIVAHRPNTGGTTEAAIVLAVLALAMAATAVIFCRILGRALRQLAPAPRPPEEGRSS